MAFYGAKLIEKPILHQISAKKFFLKGFQIELKNDTKN